MQILLSLNNKSKSIKRMLLIAKKVRVEKCEYSRLTTTIVIEYQMRCHPARLLARNPVT